MLLNSAKQFILLSKRIMPSLNRHCLVSETKAKFTLTLINGKIHVLTELSQARGLLHGQSVLFLEPRSNLSHYRATIT